jgi:hypothetical protein
MEENRRKKWWQTAIIEICMLTEESEAEGKADMRINSTSVRRECPHSISANLAGFVRKKSFLKSA